MFLKVDLLISFHKKVYRKVDNYKLDISLVNFIHLLNNSLIIVNLCTDTLYSSKEVSVYSLTRSSRPLSPLVIGQTSLVPRHSR